MRWGRLRGRNRRKLGDGEIVIIWIGVGVLGDDFLLLCICVVYVLCFRGVEGGGWCEGGVGVVWLICWLAGWCWCYDIYFGCWVDLFISSGKKTNFVSTLDDLFLDAYKYLRSKISTADYYFFYYPFVQTGTSAIL